jgi:hypothetical protein
LAGHGLKSSITIAEHVIGDRAAHESSSGEKGVEEEVAIEIATGVVNRRILASIVYEVLILRI